MTRQVLILGAGFSFHAGLPLQSDFTKALLAARDFKEGKPSRVVTDYLCQFVLEAFGHSVDAKACFWPALEDLFTCVDLSANTGHHLGRNYSPAALRTVRRALIVRIIRMLRERYRKRERQPDVRRNRVMRLVAKLDLKRTSFVSLNWDVVLEQLLAERKEVPITTYGSGERPFDFQADNLHPADHETLGVHIAKIHGSINWLYCDNCRQLYATPPEQIDQIADQLLSDTDWDRIGRVLNITVKDFMGSQRDCPRCPGVALGTRLATFSYRKALDFPMFQHTWFAAERLLAQAGTWVFIGYSLPAADFEFKYLLKRTQLARRRPARIVVVTGGGKRATKDTVENYQRFFGSNLRQDDVFENEIDETVIERL